MHQAHPVDREIFHETVFLRFVWLVCKSEMRSDRQFLNAPLALGQKLQKLQPVRVAERLSYFGKRIVNCLFWSGA